MQEKTLTIQGFVSVLSLTIKEDHNADPNFGSNFYDHILTSREITHHHSAPWDDLSGKIKKIRIGTFPLSQNQDSFLSFLLPEAASSCLRRSWRDNFQRLIIPRAFIIEIPVKALLASSLGQGKITSPFAGNEYSILFVPRSPTLSPLPISHLRRKISLPVVFAGRNEFNHARTGRKRPIRLIR
jgi:hypothetical protein